MIMLHFNFVLHFKTSQKFKKKWPRIFCINDSVRVAPLLGSSLLQCQVGAVTSYESGCEEERIQAG